MRVFKKKVSYIFESALYAYGIFMITVLIYGNWANEDVFLATVMNMVLIVGFVVLEVIERYVFDRVLGENREVTSVFKKLLIWYADGPSFKSAMYFFYIVYILYVAVSAAGVEIFTSLSDGYVQSLQYGFLFLIAADKFMMQITKDVKTAPKDA